VIGPVPPLCVALDAPAMEPVEHLLDVLEPVAARRPLLVKVGLALFTSAGPGVVADLRHRGFQVFLDLKYHDIPHQVGLAVRAAARLDVALLSVHAAGGRAMLEAAAEGARDRTRVIAVSVLTSLDDDAHRAGWGAGSVEEAVRGRLALARAAGCSGAVLSPRELGLAATFDPAFVRVVPGIRAPGEAAGDQSRTADALTARRKGATVLVVGRPITQAAHPGGVVEALLECIDRADANA